MIFIDTGAFLARYTGRDQHHQAALEGWRKIRNNKKRCHTSNFVLTETLTLLGRRAGYDFAVSRAKNIYASKALTIIRPDQSDELNALKFFDKYADQAVSFTDCVSFVLMRKAKIKLAFTFDRHFEWAGFDLFP